MNGFSAADMSTAAASAHRNGYQAGYADAVKAVEVGKPAAVQEAVAPHGWLIAVDNKCPLFIPGTHPHLVDSWREFDGATITEVYAAPVAAAPVEITGVQLGLAMTAFDAAGGHQLSYAPLWMRKALEAASTPAAPGIDHAEMIKSNLSSIKRLATTLPISHVSAANIVDEANHAITLIDASPKGGSDAEPMFYIQDTRQFVGNCPLWWAPNGAGYVVRLDEAGRFTEQDAVRQNRTRDTDVPWPCAEIDKIARLTVDHQHMRPRHERLAELQATSAEVGS